MDRITSLRKDFLYPSDEFTPISFWFWNDDLVPEEIIRQIDDFTQKGVMGFVIHPRIGIPKEIKFLSGRFLDLMEVAIKEAEKRGMTVFLYDEAMYPSGSAHGMIVANNPEYACRGIKVLEYQLEAVDSFGEIIEEIKNDVAKASTSGKVISVQLVKKLSDSSIDPLSVPAFTEDSFTPDFLKEIKDYTVLVFLEDFTGGVIRGIHFGEDSNEDGAPPYADILNPNAVQKFIEIVYETFYQRFRGYFGKTVKAIFTDEPKPLGRNTPSFYRPWTKGFLEYLQANGFKEEHLPLLWYDGGPETETVRKEFNRIVNRRLAEAYYQPISKWCSEHQIALAGHPGEADEIGFLDYFHLPGQDVVLKRIQPGSTNALEGRESTQAKCSSDAARHTGKRRNSNECFGAYGWEFTVDQMKWILDWLFVRGVNLIIPHAFYYSVAGERYAERPPDVGPNNSWWPHYKVFATYIKRLSWLMTDSINQAKVAVLCGEEGLSWEIAKPLFQNQIEFNYLQAGNFLSDACVLKNGYAQVKEQNYKTIIIEETFPLNHSLAQKLAEFMDQGGQVICYTKEQPQISSLPEKVLFINNEQDLINAITEFIGYTLKLEPYNPDLRVSHLKKGDVDFYLLVNEGEEEIKGKIKLAHDYCLEKWEPWTGRVTLINKGTPKQIGRETEVDLSLGKRESLIFVFHDCPDQALSAFSAGDTEKYVETSSLTLNSGWRVENFPVPVDSADYFKSWSEIEGLQRFSGTVIFKNEFFIKEEADKFILDCGEVHDFVQVLINGKDAGVKFWEPFLFDIGDQIQVGLNKLEIHLTNTMACKYEEGKYLSGLFGPVVLKGLKKQG